MQFKQLSKKLNHKGETRQVGFEFEYTGIDLGAAATIIKKKFGGTSTVNNKFSQTITGSDFGGEVGLEIDAHLLKEKQYQKTLKKFGIDLVELDMETKIEEIIESVASQFVPYEITLPPIPFNEIEKVENLRELLYQNKVKGTGASVIYAFGFQINIEIPELTAQVILSYLRAFILLQDWIIEKSNIDFTRRYLTSFIDDFPDEYKLLVLNEDYTPDMETFVRDYNQHNNTRNRPLDLYPLLAFIDEKYIGKVKEKELVKPRPALHYRLPNCLLDDSTWRIAQEWENWVEIDELSWNHEKLVKLSREFIQLHKSKLFFKVQWIKKIKEELHEG